MKVITKTIDIDILELFVHDHDDTAHLDEERFAEVINKQLVKKGFDTIIVVPTRMCRSWNIHEEDEFGEFKENLTTKRIRSVDELKAILPKEVLRLFRRLTSQL